MGLDILWEASAAQKENSNIYNFMDQLANKYGFAPIYEELHKFSVENSDSFWNEILDYFKVDRQGVASPTRLSKEIADHSWFPNIQLNFAENLLMRGKNEDTAIQFVHESGLRRKLSYLDLKAEVRALQVLLAACDFKESDVLAAYMPNAPETLISMLAASAMGGVFTSTSIDFGVEGVVDRLSQSKPRVLVTVPFYTYNGKTFDVRSKVQQLVRRVPEIETIIWVNFLEPEAPLEVVLDEKNISWPERQDDGAEGLFFVKRAFSDMLYIMYSSGTTGVPKCIVHSVGGTLLQHIKELGLHTDLKSRDTIFYYTTCGWMMWNWLMSSVFFGSKLIMYEGSPAYPSLKAFFENLIEKEQITIFGTSPKFLKALENSGYTKGVAKLNSLKILLSTGAPLMPEQFDFVYKNIKTDILLASICGGTDILGCFLIGNPLLPVVRGELQCRSLGMDVACFNEAGDALMEEEGELVCRNGFPSVPIKFLGDEAGEKFKNAYFNKFPGVWHHGDYIKLTVRGTCRVMGRSDATLNPGGVRIGTAEIYRQTEQISFIEDSLCVGKQTADDQEVWLFVQLKPGEKLGERREKEIKSLIKRHTTPRHVPRKIIQVDAIPYTRSGKKVELVVTRLINGREPDNLEAIANPDSLAAFRNLIID